MTSFAAGLKQMYSPEKVKNLVYSDNPLLALIPKMENFVGENYVQPVIFSNPQGGSATFANAQANKTASKIKKFTITTNKDYALASIDNETILASKNNSGAFMSAVSLETDGAFATAARSLAIALYGSGTGKLGQVISTYSSGTTITLSQASDIVNFEVGMKINFAVADGGGSVISTKPTIDSIDRNAGSFVVSDATSVLANHYIYRDGDYDNKLKGLEAWLPTSVTSSAFFGLDRTVDASRLAGIQYDGSTAPIEEVLISAASRLAREGGKPSHCFMSYEKFAELEKSLGSKVQYIDLKTEAVDVGFRGIVVNGPRGPIKVIADQNCPYNKAFLLQMDTWKLLSRGPAPQILNLDGLDKLRDASADSIELRVGYYAQLSNSAPGYNCKITF